MYRDNVKGGCKLPDLAGASLVKTVDYGFETRGAHLIVQRELSQAQLRRPLRVHGPRVPHGEETYAALGGEVVGVVHPAHGGQPVLGTERVQLRTVCKVDGEIVQPEKQPGIDKQARTHARTR